MVGDRYLTDVVWGNRHGMATVRVTPLTSKGEPPGVLLVRKWGGCLAARWGGQFTVVRVHSCLAPCCVQSHPRVAQADTACCCPRLVRRMGLTILVGQLG